MTPTPDSVTMHIAPPFYDLERARRLVATLASVESVTVTQDESAIRLELRGARRSDKAIWDGLQACQQYGPGIDP